MRDEDRADRGAGMAVVVLLHAAVIVALLQIGAVREALIETAPLFVSFVAPESPKPEVAPPPPVPPPPVPKPRPQPSLIVSEKPATAPVEFVAPPAPVEAPVVDSAPAAPAGLPGPPAAAPAGNAPKLITGVQYVRAPRVVYPMASRRLGEHGRVVVRVLIDRNGNAERVELHQGSTYQRLNEAALQAAREALYRPYSENGEPQVVWALVPVMFELN